MRREFSGHFSGYFSGYFLPSPAKPAISDVISSVIVNGGIYISFSFQLTKIRISEEKTKRKSAFLFFLEQENLKTQVKDGENRREYQTKTRNLFRGKEMRAESPPVVLGDDRGAQEVCPYNITGCPCCSAPSSSGRHSADARYRWRRSCGCR